MATPVSAARIGARTFRLKYAGPPTDDLWFVGDTSIDTLGVTWRCSVSGSPGTWVAVAGVNAGTVAGVEALMLAGTPGGAGVAIKCIEEVVDLTGNAAKYKSLTTAIPAGSSVLAVQANIEAAVTGGGTTVKVGIGLNGSATNKYGVIAALTKNTKLNTINPALPVLAGNETIDVCGVTTAGNALGDTNITAGKVRVRVVYLALTSLADA